MKNQLKKALSPKPSKKALRKTIAQKLSIALVDLKEVMSDKQFEKRIKKASKLFAVDAPRASKKLPATAKATEKKVKA